jgi:hypothetical protein
MILSSEVVEEKNKGGKGVKGNRTVTESHAIELGERDRGKYM